MSRSGYTDSSIRVLKGLEAVRARPGMYIGSTDSKGLHHLIWEILDNAVDEVINGYADEVVLTVKPDHVISISDNGRGIPVGINPDEGVSNLLVVFTILHAGGKFDNDSYKTSGGLHGVGSTCVNALSEFMKVEVNREGEEHVVVFENGGNIREAPRLIGPSEEGKNGTTVTWKPDFSIFDESEYDYDLIEKRLSTLAYLNKGKKFVFINEQSNLSRVVKEFCYERGLLDWLDNLNADKQVLHDTLFINFSGKVKDRRNAKKENDLSVSCAFQYVNEDETIAYSFCNNISTEFGGTHLESFKDGLLACIRKRSVEYKFVKDEEAIDKSDVFSGISAIVSISYVSPEYSGQTKGILSNVEIKKFIREEIEDEFNRYAEEHPEDIKRILERVDQSRKTRLKIEMTKKVDRQLAKEGFLSFAGKLADCTIKDVEFSELFIVEGDSAGGSAKGARNREFQAILPIKGKLMNVWKVRAKGSFIDNEEVKSILSAVGCGYSYGNSQFDISKLRYNKIIIMTDADVDGSHIRTLILTFLYKFMRPLIERGHVYVAQPPLYRASNSKETKYLFDESARKNFLKKETRKWDIGRFKGLGEMSPDQLWDTTMNPEKRTLLKVTVEDIEETQIQVFEDLMGNDVEPRKEFIMANYHRANIDA